MALVRNRHGIIAAVSPYQSKDGPVLHLVDVEYTDTEGAPSEQILWELEARCEAISPGQMPHPQSGQAPMLARELLEETGYRAAEIRLLLDTPTSAGMTSEIIHLFHATGLTREHDGGGTGGEDITVHHVPLANLENWLRDQQAAGYLIDFKIHAALRLAGR